MTRRMQVRARLTLQVIALMAIVLVAVVAGAALLAWRDAQTREHEVLFIVPKGTAVLQANGKDDLLLPRRIKLNIGDYDTLVIRNLDDFPVRVGPFKLEAAQQYRQRFRPPGEFKLICTTIYHEEQMMIEVVDRRTLVRKLLDGLRTG
jgi:hypothetical protein